MILKKDIGHKIFEKKGIKCFNMGSQKIANLLKTVDKKYLDRKFCKCQFRKTKTLQNCL